MSQEPSAPEVIEQRITITRQPWLKAILALATLYTLYFAQSLILPIVFSGLIALLLSPLVTRCKRVGIPRSLSSAVLLALLITPLTVLVIEIAEPAERWFQQLPKVTGMIDEQLDELNTALTPEDQKADAGESNDSGFFSWFSDEDETPEPTEENSVVEERIKQGGAEMLFMLLAATPLLIAQFFASIVLILFLLTFGPDIFHKAVRELPYIEKKSHATHLVREIQRALSRYIGTISVINIGLGVVTAAALYWIGVEDALLWGAIAGLLNYVPYLGAMVSLLILSIVGLVQYGVVVAALIPAGTFLCLTVTEAQLITPTVLGKSMQVNPLVIIVWLFISGWLWGTLGVLIAVPLLVCGKLVLQHTKEHQHWVKIIEAGQ